MGEEAEETNAKGVGGRGAGSCRVEVLSRIGRVFLQFGALKDAEVYFRRAEEAVLAEGDAGNKDHVGDNARVSTLAANNIISACVIWKLELELDTALQPASWDDSCLQFD